MENSDQTPSFPLRPTEELTPRQVRLNKARELQANIDNLQDQIQAFADGCSDLDQIRTVLRSIGRVKLPANVAASIYGTPQEGAIENLVQGDMIEGAKACRSLLKRAFTLAKSLEDVNKILVCDYRIARLESDETEVPNGSLLYGIEDELLALIQNNETVRAEIIQAKAPKSERSQTYGHFIHFCREIEATKTISPALMALEAEAFGNEIKTIVGSYA